MLVWLLWLRSYALASHSSLRFDGNIISGDGMYHVVTWVLLDVFPLEPRNIGESLRR